MTVRNNCQSQQPLKSINGNLPFFVCWLKMVPYRKVRMLRDRRYGRFRSPIVVQTFLLHLQEFFLSVFKPIFRMFDFFQWWGPLSILGQHLFVPSRIVVVEILLRSRRLSFRRRLFIHIGVMQLGKRSQLQFVEIFGFFRCELSSNRRLGFGISVIIIIVIVFSVISLRSRFVVPLAIFTISVRAQNM